MKVLDGDWSTSYYLRPATLWNPHPLPREGRSRLATPDWAADAASYLAHRDVTPDTISIASVGFAALAAIAFIALRYTQSALAQAFWFLVAIAGIQGRLVCNLLDGMVAIEGGKKTKSGVIFKYLPDRIADPLIIVPVGYAITGLPCVPSCPGSLLLWRC